MMLACSIAIIIAYSFMHMTFSDTDNLRTSEYRRSMQRGFLLIAIVYAIRAAYSLFFKFYRDVKVDPFWKLFAQISVNTFLDAPAIFVIIFINRMTIKMRKRFEEEESRRQTSNEYHNLRAADFYY